MGIGDEVERSSALLQLAVAKVAVVVGTACLTVHAPKKWQQPWRRWRRPVSGEVDERPAGAVAGTACLTVPAAKRYQPPFQRGRRPISREVGGRPAGAVADTACLTVPVAERKQQPFQPRR